MVFCRYGANLCRDKHDEPGPYHKARGVVSHRRTGDRRPGFWRYIGRSQEVRKPISGFLRQPARDDLMTDCRVMTVSSCLERSAIIFTFTSWCDNAGSNIRAPVLLVIDVKLRAH